MRQLSHAQHCWTPYKPVKQNKKKIVTDWVEFNMLLLESASKRDKLPLSLLPLPCLSIFPRIMIAGMPTTVASGSRCSTSFAKRQWCTSFVACGPSCKKSASVACLWSCWMLWRTSQTRCAAIKVRKRFLGVQVRRRAKASVPGWPADPPNSARLSRRDCGRVCVFDFEVRQADNAETADAHMCT
jgi:hypothetical protein